MAKIEIFLTNLGKYNEGDLVGEWFELGSSFDLDAALLEIGVDGKEYEEYFITDSETDFEGIDIGEYSDIKKLNELAIRIEDLDTHEEEALKAIIEATGYPFGECLDILQRENYSFYSGMDLEDLAREFVDEGMFGNVSDNLLTYIDFEALGNDLSYDYTEVSNGVIRID